MSSEDEDASDRLEYMVVAARPLAEEDDVVARAATALWDAGLEPELAGLSREDYARRMAASAIRALFRLDARHVDDKAGRQLYPQEIREQRWDGSDLATADRAAIEGDCQAFLRRAWPWLRLERTGPEDAGEEFHRARSGHEGFGVDAYGLCAASLRTISGAFPELSVRVKGSPEKGFEVAWTSLGDPQAGP